MRPGQHQNNKRMRGRNRGKGPNPLNRSYESNGPDVKIRGSAQHIAEKYLQLSRDAAASGDRVMAENYMQHAEHYFRILAAAQAQFAPHLPAYVRPDEQQFDDDEDFEDVEGAPAALGPDGQPLPPAAPEAVQGGAQGHQGQHQRHQQGQNGYPQRGERGDRGDFRNRDRFDRRDRDFRDRDRDFRDRDQRPAAPMGERPDMGEQPSVDFPQPRRDERFGERGERGERPDRGGRPDRGPRGDRPPREPRPERVAAEPDTFDGVEGDAAPVVAAAEPATFSDEGREPGLPSFLTRTRRRGRPAYRRRDGEEAEAGAEGDDAPVPPANPTA